MQLELRVAALKHVCGGGACKKCESEVPLVSLQMHDRRKQTRQHDSQQRASIAIGARDLSLIRSHSLMPAACSRPKDLLPKAMQHFSEECRATTGSNFRAFWEALKSFLDSRP